MEILGDFFQQAPIVIWKLLAFLGMLTILIFVHELGHYWVARYNKVRVLVFSIGFGPELLGWTDKANTRWKISYIPLGGYIKMYGESESNQPYEELLNADKKVSFAHKSLGQRAAIVAAGPLANFAFAIIVLATLFITVGQPFTPPTVTSVQEGSAAERGGIIAGDSIIKIDTQAISRFEEVQQIIRMNQGKEILIVVHRDNSEVHLQVTPQIFSVSDRFGNNNRIGILGITGLGSGLIKHNPVTAFWFATKETITLTKGMLQVVGQVISGSRSAKELGGPIKIAQMSGEFSALGLIPFIMFTVLLSINLGLINLFPIPMLDGGHLFFYAIEGVRGKPLNEKVQEISLRIGLAFVVGLMIFVTINDVVQLPFLNSL